ncbi:MAG: NTP transferase domain-containing protein [Dehalococcoidales bacterium]|nr:NTP transferase domain-containing protein [Dehalococcoidales bacterium]
MNVNAAVVLAAGEGSRMRPLTYTRPKVMLPIANRPILEHLLVELRSAGIREFTFIVGYHDEQIRDYFGSGEKWDVTVQYFNQRTQKGTADALKQVQGTLKERFIMVNGDVILHHNDIQRLLQHDGNVMSVVELQDVEGMGVIETELDKVKRIYEKSANPPTKMANAGLYLFTSDIFEAIEKTEKSPRGEYEITDSIQILVERTKNFYFQVIDQWMDLSYPWQLLTANEQILACQEAQCQGEIEPNVVIKGAVTIGQGTVVRSGTYIIGPVIIGMNCDIGPNCYIRPSTSIGDCCHIGAAVEIKNSIIMSGTKIPHFNYVGDSVIGQNCNLGAGTKIANLKLDKSNIKINQVDTKRRKLGAIIGDGVETGINSSINVGTIIGNNTFIGPGALAHGIIAPNSKVF